MNKLMASLFIIAACLCSNNVYGEILTFKVGDKASYQITQNVKSDNIWLGKKRNDTSESKLIMDVKILSANSETGSYPFDVEVTIKNLSIYEIQQGKKDKVILDNAVVAEHVKKIIDHPLVFRIEGDFQVKEVSEYLAKINKEYDRPSVIGIFGTTPWFFEFFLTQLFHLSGENLQKGSNYPKSCYQLLNWEDDALDEKNIDIHQSSHYSITDLDSQKIRGTWNGVAKVTGEFDGNVKMLQNVTWMDPTNYLIQKRNLEVTTEFEADFFNGYGAEIKMFVTQENGNQLIFEVTTDLLQKEQ